MSRLAFVTLLAACTSSPSPTGLQPQIFLNSFDAQLRVNIGVQTRTPIDVSATFRGQTITARTSTAYSGTADASNALLLFDLEQPLVAEEPVSMAVDGVEVRINEPPPFDDVQVPASISRSQPGTISWTTTSPDSMSFLMGSSCARGSGSIPPNARSVTFTPSTWIHMDGDDPNASCQITARLYRDRTGSLDRAFEDTDGNEQGSLRWEQIYDASFTSTP